MHSFVRPQRATAADGFTAWFEAELDSYWREDFGNGVLVLKLPAEL